MKNLLISILLSLIVVCSYAQYTAIPDSEFEQTLISQGIDSEGTLDGQILTHDINTITVLDVSYQFDITDLTGIQDFIALENLNCANNSLTAIDLSNNTSLLVLNCQHNELTSLDVSNNILLEELYCGNPALDVGPFNILANLDLGNNINLKIIECIAVLQNITTIDLSANTNLVELYCSFNNITNLDLTNNTQLEIINVNFCELTGLHLETNTALRDLTVARVYPMIPWSNTNQIQSLNLTHNIALEIFWFEDSVAIEELNLKNGTNNVLLNVHAEENPNLTCITVDDETAANAGDYPYSEWDVDTQVFYSENCVLGIESLEDYAIMLFPNPISNFLNIENTAERIDKIEVFDLLGKIIAIKKIDTNQIDFTNLKKGIYFVQLYSGNTVLTKKVIKK